MRDCRGAACLLALVALGCEAESEGLGLGEGLDAGAADAPLVDAASHDGGGVSIDAAVGPDADVDAGVVDADVADAASPDAGSQPMCAQAQSFRMEVQGFGPEGYSGRLVQAPTGVIRLQTPDGSGFITFFGPTPSALFDPIGFDAELDVYGDLRTEAALVLWRVDAAGRRLDFALKAWSGSREYVSIATEDVSFFYRDEPCAIFSDECGTNYGQTLLAIAHDDAAILTPGRGIAETTYEFYNGQSHRFVDPPLCMDAAEQWYEGFIATTAPRECANMQRDACIASERCVLWGSENHDPGYICVPAQGRCEPIVNPPECRATTGCAWVPGDCYCPEGQDCFCAGEPAPKCVHRCGTIALCPTGQYCDEPLALPQCQPAPVATGSCELIPSSCAGVPSVSVCACGANGAQTFASDCASRQAQASGRTPGACPP